MRKKLFLLSLLFLPLAAVVAAETEGDYVTREMHCKSRDGKNIWGMAYIPNTAEVKKPLVVMAHGYGGTHKEPTIYAEHLAAKGVACYIFDFCGGGNRSKSEGKTTEMTIFTEVENVEDIIQTAKTWNFVDTTRVALLGCSQGGLVSALTAGRNPEQLKALVLIYPALMIPATAPMMLKRFEANNNEPLDVMGTMLSRDYYDVINGLPVFDRIAKFRKSTLMVYGDKDRVTSAEMVERVKQAYTNLRSQLIPDGTHGFPNPQHKAQAVEAVVAFICDVL